MKAALGDRDLVVRLRAEDALIKLLDVDAAAAVTMLADGVATSRRARPKLARKLGAIAHVAEAPWSEAEWAVALRFDNPRATVLVLVLG